MKKAFSLPVCLVFIIALSSAVFYACGSNSEVPGSGESATRTDPARLFASKCSMCHDFKQDRIGPSLSGVYERWQKDDSRLQRFIKNSSKMIAEGDPYAVALYEKWNKANMPAFESLSDEEIKALCDYMKQ